MREGYCGKMGMPWDEMQEDGGIYEDHASCRAYVRAVLSELRMPSEGTINAAAEMLSGEFAPFKDIADKAYRNTIAGCWARATLTSAIDYILSEKT